jgi:hypothetical protein
MFVHVRRVCVCVRAGVRDACVSECLFCVRGRLAHASRFNQVCAPHHHDRPRSGVHTHVPSRRTARLVSALSHAAYIVFIGLSLQVRA